MGTRGDFYVMDHDGSMEWLGSVIRDGGIYNIPADILISGDKIMYEEKVEEYLKFRFDAGIIKSIYQGWPWPWVDSRMTDYSYIFDVCKGQVLVSIAGGRLLDSIKLVQGMDEIGADVGAGNPKFPMMMKEDYGQDLTEAV